jgi:parallel beta-helix repeat protein
LNAAAEEPYGGTPIDLEPLGLEYECYDNSSGTFFEVTDSSYFNVSLTSSENVFVYLYSVPKIVSFSIESDCISDTTNLILSGFEPNKIYYIYENGDLQSEFTIDGSGSYAYTQDISTGHFISIKEEISTIYIKSDGTVVGAPAGAITFDSTLTFYDLNMNINDGVVIQRSGITFNGNGNSVTGPGWGNGIELVNSLHDVTVNDTFITGWSYGVMISGYANYNTISNCSITGNYYGIWGNEQSHHNDIIGNTIDSNTYSGIYLCKNTQYYLITGNDILNSQYYHGIYLHISKYNTISYNTISFHGTHGIFLESYSSVNIIKENKINKNYYGIRMNNRCNWNNIYDNILTNNALYGLRMDNYCDRNTVSRNNLSDNGWCGILLYGWCDFNTISDNDIMNNEVVGLYLHTESNNNVISGNTISNNKKYGVYMYWYCYNNNFNSNTISNNGHRGFASYYSDSNTITDNTITYTIDYDAIYLKTSNYNIISGNILTNNGQCGIQLRESCHQNIIENNDLSWNRGGIIFATSCYENTIKDNIITNNYYYGGVGLWWSCYDNTIYNNYFENNNYNALDTGEYINIWNIDKTLGTNIIGGPYLGGNYWDDYTGVDNTGDGLGDTDLPYYCNGFISNGGDYLPLILANLPPVACAGGPYIVDEGTAVLFDASCSSDPDNDVLQFRWDFDGDGVFDTTLSTDPTASFTWYDEYAGDAIVDVFDGTEWVLDWAQVIVNNVAPAIEPLSAPVESEGKVVILTGTAADPGSDDLTFTWSWGDGTPNTATFYPSNGVYPMDISEVATHVYGDNGVFTVTLTVEDDDGGTTTVTTTVTVNNVDPGAMILGGIGIADNYIFANNWYGQSYIMDILSDGSFATPELIDDKSSGTYGAGIGDFDNDGDLDALVGDAYNTWYYEKLGPGNDFAPAISIESTYRGSRMDFAEADYNNDGNLDAIMADYGSTYYTLYTGNGDGTFTISTMPAPLEIIGMDAADFNGDGNMDFIAAHWWYEGAFIYLGNGDGTFQSPINVFYGLDSWGVCAGDFNNDGDDDVIFGYYPVMFYPGNGDGTFGTPVNLGFYAYGLAEADINGDGNLDLVYTDTNNICYRTGNGDGTFTFESATYIASSLYSIAVSPESGGGLEANEGELIEFDGTFSDLGWLDTHTATWNWGDGSPTETGIITQENLEPMATGEVSGEYTYGDNGDYTVTLSVFDDDGGSGFDTITVTVNNVAPMITTLTAPVDPVQLGNPITADAEFTDPGFLDTHTASIDWGDDITEDLGTVTSPIPTQTHTYASPGVYTITLTVTDDDGDSDTMSFKYVVIYDPSDGFVTGGGWINSPEGAYTPDPTLTGKANFGFVAKYKKGQSTPDGNTEFNFKVANMNFHSNNYEWLVIIVAGAKAMYKGTGTINGEGNYGFQLSAIDEDLTPSTDVDLFRIKIWDKDNNDEIIYDNQLGEEDDSDPTTQISGGSIKIHKN